jgi:hypothetical protein
VPLALTYNLHYSGGRNQEDHSSKPAQPNSSQKRAGIVAQGVGPEFKPQYLKKKKSQFLVVHLLEFIEIELIFFFCSWGLNPEPHAPSPNI